VPETKRQMMLYTLMLIPLTIMPALLGVTGLLYGLAALLLGGRFLQLCWKILREEGVTPTSWKLYKYSLSYLALLFVAMAVDRWIPLGHVTLPQHVDFTADNTTPPPMNMGH
jgi:protoheme IX farnesyltransferase